MPSAPGLTFSGERLRQERLARRSDDTSSWTITQLGRRLGVSHVAVLRWEQGSRIPELHHLRALCRLLEVEPWDLMPPPEEGPHLIHLRIRSFLTQLQVADRLKIAMQTYSSVENGERPLTPPVARDLAKAFRTPLEQVEAAHARTISQKREVAIALRDVHTPTAVMP